MATIYENKKGVDPSPFRSRGHSHPPPPSTPYLTEKILNMASSCDRREEIDEHGRNEALPNPSSPTDSVAKAMKSDLEELIGYIDNLAFDETKERPVPKSLGTPSMHKELFPNDHNPSNSSSNFVLRDRTNKFMANIRQTSMLDKLNESVAATVLSPTRYHDSSMDLAYKRNESEPKLLEPMGNRPGREEPAGSPPPQEASLYFHDESFSLNLSQSQEVDETIISDQHLTDKRPMEELENNKSGRPPRLLSTLEKNGLVSPPERSKSIAFTSISKDPTPSKPFHSTSSARENENHFATPNVKSKAYSVDKDESDVRRERLAARKATPFPQNQDRGLDRSEHENLDRKGNEWWRARPIPPQATERGSSLRFDVTDSSAIHESSNDESLQKVEHFASPISKPRYARGTPHPSKKGGNGQSQGIVGAVLETPAHQATNSNLVLTSPESAKKLLRTAMEALQDARKERDEARQWAEDMKRSVNEWVEDQRRMIRTETTSIADHSNNVPTALFEGKNHAVESLIADLRNEMKSSNFDAESKLNAINKKQDEKIEELSRQLAAVKDQLATIILKKEKSKIARAQSVIGSQSKHSVKAQGLTHKTPINDTTKLVRSASRSDGSHSSQRTRRATPSGGHLIDYGNGVTKELHPDGTTVTRFKNGDVETRFVPGTSTTSNPAATCMVAYYHCKEEVLQITQRDGSVLYEYANGQVERHCADGVKIVLFPDGTKTIV